MVDIRNLAQGLWTVERPHNFLGIDVGGRMTVIGLPSGGEAFRRAYEGF